MTSPTEAELDVIEAVRDWTDSLWVSDFAPVPPERLHRVSDAMTRLHAEHEGRWTRPEDRG